MNLVRKKIAEFGGLKPFGFGFYQRFHKLWPFPMKNRSKNKGSFGQKATSTQSHHGQFIGESSKTWGNDTKCQTATLVHACQTLVTVIMSISPHFSTLSSCLARWFLGQFLSDFVRVKGYVSPRPSTSTYLRQIFDRTTPLSFKKSSFHWNGCISV